METPLCWKFQYYGRAEIWRGASLSLQNKLCALRWQSPRSRDPCAICSSEDHASVPDLRHWAYQSCWTSLSLWSDCNRPLVRLSWNKYIGYFLFFGELTVEKLWTFREWVNILKYWLFLYFLFYSFIYFLVVVLGIEPRTLGMLSKCSTNELISPAQDLTFKVNF